MQLAVFCLLFIFLQTELYSHSLPFSRATFPQGAFLIKNPQRIMACYWLRWRCGTLGLVLFSILSLTLLLTPAVIYYYFFVREMTPMERAEEFLSKVPLIVGRNEFPSNLRKYLKNDLSQLNFSQDLSHVKPWSLFNNSQTDIPRLKAGRVKAQIWVADVDCSSQFKDAVSLTLEQIDVIKRLIGNFSNELKFVDSTAEAPGLVRAMEGDNVANLISIGGGHSIQSSLGVLRLYYDLGVRSLAITNFCSTPWADGGNVDSGHHHTSNGTERPKPNHFGLSQFGEDVILEMNRLGMIVDASRSSIATMKEVLILSKSPVIFSHSGARALCDHSRNVPDNVLNLVRKRDGLVMVAFHPESLKCGNELWMGNVTVRDVVDHIEYIRNKTSVENVGIGAAFDGISRTPRGLEDVSKFHNLFSALIETGRWTDDELELLAGKNFLRVLAEVEKVRDDEKKIPPIQSRINMTDLNKIIPGKNIGCITT